MIQTLKKAFSSLRFRRRFWIAVTLIIMGAIFFFSSQGTGTSEDLSDGVADFLRIEQKEESTRVSNQQLFFHLTLRKIAHIVIFAALGFSMFQALEGRKGRAPAAVLLSYAYGVLDELHQTWIGRYGRWQDTVIDLAGILIGVGAALLLGALYRRIKDRM